MRKFISSFVFTFVLAISFLVPIQNVSAETTASSDIFANISPVSMTRKETHYYSYVVCPGSVAFAQPSFFTRLLAAVGINKASTQKLAEGSTDCDVKSITSKVTNLSWSCIPSTEWYDASKRGNVIQIGRKFICSNEKAKK